MDSIYISAFRNIQAILKLVIVALKGDAISRCDRNKLLLFLLKSQMPLVMMAQSKRFPAFFENMAVRKVARGLGDA